MKVNFYCQSFDLDNPPLQSGSTLFHGRAIDQRGEAALSAANSIADINSVPIFYNYDDLTLEVGDVVINAEECHLTIESHIRANNKIVIEATTLGFSELFCIIRSLILMKHYEFEIVYIEPLDYSHATSNSFSLSEKIVGYQPIPPAIIDLSDPDVERGVFFLGYESNRLERALEEYQMIATKDVKVVFGIPAFKPGWELNSIIPHLQILSDRSSIEHDYCAANDPEAAFQCLEDTRASLPLNAQMFVAPLGTKPCGIATAVFASLYPDQVGLLYDHPQKKKNRSIGTSIWHSYSTKIIN